MRVNANLCRSSGLTRGPARCRFATRRSPGPIEGEYGSPCSSAPLLRSALCAAHFRPSSVFSRSPPHSLEVSLQVLDEMVKRKTLVAYTALNQVSGAGEYSHVFILEFSDWTAYSAFPAKRNEAAQAVFHKSFNEAIAGYADLRRHVRDETYVPAGQQP